MVFHRPNPRLIVFPPELQNIERVNNFKLLGIQLHPDFNFSDYVTTLVTTCNQRLNLIYQLRQQGLGLHETDMVFKSIVLSKITYAIPMLFGYLTEDHIKQICSIFKKAMKWQLTLQEYDFRSIAENIQCNLFQQSKSSSHCLFHLYRPSLNTSSMMLRNRGHNFFVPSVKFYFNSKNFIARALSQYR